MILLCENDVVIQKEADSVVIVREWLISKWQKKVIIVEDRQLIFSAIYFTHDYCYFYAH